MDAFRRKLMIPDSEIIEYPEYEVKSKIGNIFVKKNKKKYSKNILLRFMKLIVSFLKVTEKKQKTI